jgi:hypothetical protein
MRAHYTTAKYYVPFNLFNFCVCTQTIPCILVCLLYREEQVQV